MEMILFPFLLVIGISLILYGINSKVKETPSPNCSKTCDIPVEKIPLYYNLDDPKTIYTRENNTFKEIEVNK